VAQLARQVAVSSNVKVTADAYLSGQLGVSCGLGSVHPVRDNNGDMQACFAGSALVKLNLPLGALTQAM
jgi:hypothetical protein